MDDIDIDLTADIDAMGTEELLNYQQALSRARLEINDRQRAVQKRLDEEAQLVALRRAQEDQILGQVSKPPPQEVF